MNARRGFTLVEVMVALLVLALALTALQYRMTQHVDSSAYLRAKAIAGWVAADRMTLLRLENRRRNMLLLEERRGVSPVAGRDWYWRIRPMLEFGQLPGEGEIVPVVIEVAEAGDFESPLYTLEGVVDAYHRL